MAILVEIARRKQSVRKLGGLERIDWSDLDLALSEPDEQRLIAPSDALDPLKLEDLRCAELVKLRLSRA